MLLVHTFKCGLLLGLFGMFIDIRELISLDDVMEELGMWPNGGLIYCMEYPVVCKLSLFIITCCLPSYLVLN